MTVFDPESLLRVLVEHGVDFVVIGGIAISMHGVVRATQDVDVYYERSLENIASLCAALAVLEPRLRGAEDVPVRVDTSFIQHGENFTFVTNLGSFDCLGFVDGAPPYEVVKGNALTVDVGGVKVLVASVTDLISMKRAAGRATDQLDIVALQKVLDLSTEP